ncbi:MAG: LamG-like jellyroll fold domain-containing protein [Bacteroidia bacterium]
MKKYKPLALLAVSICFSISSALAQNGNTCLMGHYTMSGNAKDLSSQANHCTVDGATLTKDRFNNSNSAYYFNGSASLYAPLDTRPFEAMSVTAWIKTTYTSQQATIIQIVNPVLYTNRFSSNKFFSSFDGSTSDNSSSQETSTDVADGEWIFVAAVCDGSTTKLYVNDSLESTFNESLYKSNGQMTIGLQSNNMWGFTGAIDEVRIYKCALSGTDIKDIYDEESKQPTSVNDFNKQKQEAGFSFYPNPTNSSLNVSLNITSAAQLQILDVTGRIVYAAKVKPTEQQLALDMSGYMPGVYFIQLNAGQRSYTQKLIIE